VAFNVYIGLLVWPLRMLGMIVAQAQRAAVSGQRVHEVLASEPAIVDPPHPVALPHPVPLPLPPSFCDRNVVLEHHIPVTEREGDDEAAGRGVGELRFDKVVFAYGEDGPRVLDGFELTIAAGESVALVGATASGKSTVARLVPRFYDVDGGGIVLDGVDVRDVRLSELRRAVGLVFEDTFLFSDTIAANIAFARPDAPHEVVERAARLAGVDDFVGSLADGYETHLGERGYSLSGGQRQRIAIARAIVADPRVLILDDATSAVDPTKEHEIRDALVEVMRGRTTIVIAHRPATIALADRVVLLDGGVVAADGTHAQLLATSSRYRQVLAAAHLEDADTRDGGGHDDGHDDGHDGDGHDDGHAADDADLAPPAPLTEEKVGDVGQ
jgi:ATP-binding cassette, subfamily B, bacterial